MTLHKKKHQLASPTVVTALNTPKAFPTQLCPSRTSHQSQSRAILKEAMRPATLMLSSTTPKSLTGPKLTRVRAHLLILRLISRVALVEKLLRARIRIVALIRRSQRVRRLQLKLLEWMSILALIVMRARVTQMGKMQQLLTTVSKSSWLNLMSKWQLR